MTHNELINLVRTPLIVTNPNTTFDLNLSQSRSDWKNAALISLPRIQTQHKNQEQQAFLAAWTHPNYFVSELERINISEESAEDEFNEETGEWETKSQHIPEPKEAEINKLYLVMGQFQGKNKKFDIKTEVKIYNS